MGNMSHWLTHVIFLCLLWHSSMGQDDAQVCHHIDAMDYQYTVQCHNLNASNAIQLTLVMDDVRFKYPYDRLKIMVDNSVGDALPDDVLDGYVIQAVLMTNCGFTSVPFRLITKLPPYLVNLNLSNNKISSIDFQRFNELPYASSLLYLTLDSNLIESLPEDAFINFRRLLGLKLRDNLLTRLEDNTFRGLVQLQSLFLNSNQIQTVGRDAFAVMEQLSMVSLDLNKVEFLEEGTFSKENQTSLYEIPLEGNPFHCNCSLQWLKEYLESIHYLELSGATCIYPRIDNFQNMDFCSTERADTKVGHRFDADSTGAKISGHQNSVAKNIL